MPQNQHTFLRSGLGFTPLVLILCVWCIVNWKLFSVYGVKVVSDSPRYTDYANGLASGFYIDTFDIWYIGYVLYLFIIFKVLGAGITSAIVGQYVLSFLSVIALYRTTFLLSRSTVSAVVASLLFVAFPDISQWNSYILTESLYISFTCFSFYFLVVCQQNTTTKNMVIAIAVLIFTFFIKPTGIALFGALLGVIAFTMYDRIQKPALRIAMIAGLSIILLVLANGMMSKYMIMENYQAGEIIYDVRTYTGNASTDGLAIDPPDDLYFPSPSKPIVVKVFLFAICNPLYWTKLTALKIYYLLSHTRPFWSVMHNVYSLLILVPSYILALMSFKRLNKPVLIFAITFLLIHILSVGITSEDWDGRFLMPLLPAIFILSGIAVNFTLKSKVS